ncbi:MAG TPA: putative zinc-binding protein [Terriglobales bacterium]|jgi:uncharacterized metal-binding protein|nr:putative zinc-binding protein [Terriglobales bacterium]
MNDDRQAVVIVPCSGIGKSLGSVTREAAYELCDSLRPSETRLVALSKLVLGDAEARERVRTSPAVTIDGCKQMCASKLVRHNGGTVVREVAVFEAFRNHKNLKPEGIAELNAEGKQLARLLAEEIADQLDGIRRPGAEQGGQHA